MFPDAAARQVIAAYQDSRADELHVLARVLSCPVVPVLEALPAAGTVLDVGCGHGLFTLLAATAAPDLHLVGSDIDADKVARARRAADRLGVADRVEFRVSTDGSLPADRADAVLCVDVLYLLGDGPAVTLLDAMAAAVRPGGVVVVKEMADRPRWKARWNHLQEVGATRVFGYTEGDRVEPVAPDRITGALRAAGMAVRETPLDRWYPHPHLLVVATRPG